MSNILYNCGWIIDEGSLLFYQITIYITGLISFVTCPELGGRIYHLSWGFCCKLDLSTVGKTAIFATLEQLYIDNYIYLGLRAKKRIKEHLVWNGLRYDIVAFMVIEQRS